MQMKLMWGGMVRMVFACRIKISVENSNLACKNEIFASWHGFCMFAWLAWIKHGSHGF
jgi:lysophospholipid acyltransferase (LPLAT)-like uncharacterized protein